MLIAPVADQSNCIETQREAQSVLWECRNVLFHGVSLQSHICVLICKYLFFSTFDESVS